MAEEGKIYITISDGRNGTGSNNSGISGSGSASSSSSKDGTGSGNAESSMLAGYAKHQFFAFVSSEAKNIVNYSISNIGNFTGNYQAQADVQVAMSALSSIANIANGAVQGAMIGGPIGALIGAGVTLGFQAINFGLSEYSNRMELSKTNEQIKQLYERSGNNTLLDGSRGTLY